MEGWKMQIVRNLLKVWCPRPGSNRHGELSPRDFKTVSGPWWGWFALIYKGLFGTIWQAFYPKGAQKGAQLSSFLAPFLLFVFAPAAGAHSLLIPGHTQP